jgi:hypothetical protein
MNSENVTTNFDRWDPIVENAKEYFHPDNEIVRTAVVSMFMDVFQALNTHTRDKNLTKKILSEISYKLISSKLDKNIDPRIVFQEEFNQINNQATQEKISALAQCVFSGGRIMDDFIRIYTRYDHNNIKHQEIAKEQQEIVKNIILMATTELCGIYFTQKIINTLTPSRSTIETRNQDTQTTQIARPQSSSTQVRSGPKNSPLKLSKLPRNQDTQTTQIARPQSSSTQVRSGPKNSPLKFITLSRKQIPKKTPISTALTTKPGQNSR